jgi:hypothetical protein
MWTKKQTELASYQFTFHVLVWPGKAGQNKGQPLKTYTLNISVLVKTSSLWLR